ncbi:signal peptidase II [Microbacterium sp. X-17]|uniref:signal peptidase II n=1 Tax=Microbacterium sp. X-17 TaxID=3144404 RepID=UPI0031F559C6
MTETTEPSERPEDTEFPRRRSRALVLILVIAVVVVLADQLTKLWATASLQVGVYHSLIGNLLGIQLIYNSGAAFSFLVDQTWVFTIIAALAVVALLYFSRRVGARSWAVAFGLLLGGAVTHLGDRLFRAPSFGQGHVVDFIAYANWFIGNVADIAIFCGAVLALILAVVGVPLRGGPRHTHDDSARMAG